MFHLSILLLVLGILEVGTPIRMFFPTSLCVPTHWPISEVFGSYPGVTVKEILVSFLRRTEVIECDYSLPTGFFHFDFPTRNVGGWGFSYLPVRYWFQGFIKNLFTGNECWECCLILAPNDLLVESSEEPWFGAMRHVLMMTVPRVGSTLKIPDDGTFGKCRNSSWNWQLVFNRTEGLSCFQTSGFV